MYSTAVSQATVLPAPFSPCEAGDDAKSSYHLKSEAHLVAQQVEGGGHLELRELAQRGGRLHGHVSLPLGAQQ
eukprot:7883013-Pyramimonas_sp.AAC.1